MVVVLLGYWATRHNVTGPLVRPTRKEATLFLVLRTESHRNKQKSQQNTNKCHIYQRKVVVNHLRSKPWYLDLNNNTISIKRPLGIRSVEGNLRVEGVDLSLRLPLTEVH